MTSPAPSTHSRHVVTPGWLAASLGAPDLVVLDCSYFLPTMMRDADVEYELRHIPGALRFDIEKVADQSTDLPHMLPSREEFAAMVGAMGISERDTIVCYDAVGMFSSPRAWWTFRLFGAESAFVLEGGLPAWMAAGLPIEKGIATRAPARFAAREPADVIADIARVRRALADGSAQVVDARSAERFRGIAPEPRPGLRSGHMPGSLSLPYAEVLRDGAFLRPHDEIRTAFEAAGVDLARPIVTTCGSGVTAAILWLALDAIGVKPAGLYDGSWCEWGAREDLPVATDI